MTTDRLPALSLPAYGARLRDAGGVTQIFDSIRNKWVVLTPEEWVRQHFVNMLVRHYGYSPFRLANERSIRINGQLKRCDTLIYNDTMQPVGIVEYKAPDIAVTQKVFDQIARYNLVIGAPLLIVSNGIHTYALAIHGTPGEKPQVRWLDGIPTPEHIATL